MKNKPLIVLFLFCCSVIFFTKPVLAGEITLPITDDAYIHEVRRNENYGRDTTLYVSSDDLSRKVILMKFDVSGIPKNSIITSASLSMRADGCSGPAETPKLQLSYATEDWDERTVLWSNKPRVGSQIALVDAIPRTKVFDVSKAVAAWVKGTTTNKGVVLTMQGNYYVCVFDSKEVQSEDVKLTVGYVPPLKTLPNLNLNVPLTTTQASVAATPMVTPLPSETPMASTETTEQKSDTTSSDQEDTFMRIGNTVVTPMQVVIALLGVITVLVLALIAALIRKPQESKTVVVVNEKGEEREREEEKEE